MSDNPKNRPIRSFVLRKARMTPGQSRAYDRLWQQWGLEPVEPLNFEQSFGREGQRILEIGFGMGQSLVEMAAAAPESNFVGIDVHKPGVGRLLHSMESTDTQNIRVYCHDAVEVLRDCVVEDSLDVVQIFFPDPWHKKRHNKRRLIQAPFVSDLVKKLRVGGRLHLATDWENYAEQMMEVLSENADLNNEHGPGVYAPRPEYRPLTKFEKRGERLGHGVWDLIFTRI